MTVCENTARNPTQIQPGSFTWLKRQAMLMTVLRGCRHSSFNGPYEHYQDDNHPEEQQHG